jgi:sorbitol/mannitol transport system substrate-binding protein
MRSHSRRRVRAVIGIAAANVLLAACAGAGSLGQSNNTINVLMVNNPQMVELQKLTAKYFTKKTGIKVKFTSLPENDVRDKIGQDFANQAGQYDVASISNYETPTYAKNNWLEPLNGYIAKDKKFDQKDVLGPLRESLKGEDGKTYAEPFYGESSFLMYRKDIFKKEHLKMPAKPTWQQVADLAAKVDGAQKGTSGICLRGLPGWGEMIAPLTTVANTFGGTWFDQDFNARLTSPGFANAVKFYTNLVKKHGESGAAQSGFAECLNNMTQGKSAMWYDATSAAGSLEAAKSPVKGKIGYVAAPTVKTEHSGWLYSWSWGIQKASHNKENAWKFLSWASSKQYERLVGEKFGWADVPAGKRASTYRIPQYNKSAGAFGAQTKQAIESADPRNPGVQKRPAMGIQFVDIPEFSDLGTKVSQELSSAIAGRESVSTALKKSQQLAQQVGKEYQGQ